MSNPNLMTGPAGRGAFVKLPYPDGQATFTMGSNRWKASQPVREVTLTKPIAMQEALLTVDEYRDHIEICARDGISHGRLFFGRDGHLVNMFCADSEIAVRNMDIDLLAEQSSVLASDVLQLVPTMEQFEARYAELERGAEFLKGNHPVVLVSRPEVVMCASYYFGGRLATEAEWEYAARAGRAGDDIAGTDTGKVTTQNAHYRYGRSVGATMPVKSYAPNPWGLYDMAGNVWEWVQDGRKNSYEGLPAIDPVGSLMSEAQVVRGGCWRSGVDFLCAAFRDDDGFLFGAGRCGTFGVRVVVPQP